MRIISECCSFRRSIGLNEIGLDRLTNKALDVGYCLQTEKQRSNYVQTMRHHKCPPIELV